MKTCNNDVYIQPANLLFYLQTLLVENSAIDKHRLNIKFISCFSEKKIQSWYYLNYNLVGTLNILLLSLTQWFYPFLSGKSVKLLHDITKQKSKLLIFNAF